MQFSTVSIFLPSGRDDFPALGPRDALESGIGIYRNGSPHGAQEGKIVDAVAIERAIGEAPAPLFEIQGDAVFLVASVCGCVRQTARRHTVAKRA